MAAEARLDLFSNQATVAALKFGNNRSSKFTDAQAQKLIDDGWAVVEHKPDTSTGFSGTLFKNTKTDELVMSFRSTEFIDDAARDNEATNKWEVAEGGWATGQIADMEDWFKKLNQSGGPLAGGKHFSVTGYITLPPRSICFTRAKVASIPPTHSTAPASAQSTVASF